MTLPNTYRVKFILFGEENYRFIIMFYRIQPQEVGNLGDYLVVAEAGLVYT